MKRIGGLFLTVAVITVVFLSGFTGAVTTASCADSDGGKVYTVKGGTVGSNGKKIDKCRSPAVLEEYYCEGTLAKMDLQKCEGGCVNGYCRGSATTEIVTPESVDLEEITPVTTDVVAKAGTTASTTVLLTVKIPITGSNTLCTDSDGGQDYYVKGTTKGVNGEFPDTCSSHTKVKEWYCKGSRATNDFFKCQNRCSNGACTGTNPKPFVPTTTSTTTTMVYNTVTVTSRTTSTTLEKSTEAVSGNCIESDQGQEYDVKGSTNGVNGHFDDKCVNPTQLREYYCEGSTAKVELVRCEKGCYTGRCR